MDVGISWLSVISTIFLIVGLALDYDILLFSRVHELRQTSVLQTREAVNQALALTGPMTSGAGLIMLLTLGAMAVSSSVLLNQMIFILFVGVIVDVLIVRILLVPCVLSTCGWINWWPKPMPMNFD